MTRLYISADLEGICGVTSLLQCSAENDAAAYEAAVSQMALEVETVVQTALEAGVKYILVNDAHCTMTNLQLGDVSERVALLSGKPKVCAMAAGLDDSFDAAIFLGYHAKAGTENGVLCHSFHHNLANVRVNHRSFGEGGINALYASFCHGVPLILTSGDRAYCEEITELIPTVATVETKVGLGFAAAITHPWESVEKDYEEKLKIILSQKKHWRTPKSTIRAPFTLEVTFNNTLNADSVMMMPGWARRDGTSVVYQTTDNFKEVYQAMQSAYALCAYTSYQGI